MLQRPPISTLFPTRRSSDLKFKFGLRFDVRDLNLEYATEKMGAIAKVLEFDTFGTADRPGLVSDRKSTRLNSSHMSISYAVFCLKKKNKLLTDYTTTIISFL